MKVKELLKTVNVAWSPPQQYPILLAAGTAAQQLDASFNTSASLDLYSLNLQQPGYEMELQATVPSENRFHKIIWGAGDDNSPGIIVGGCDHGIIQIYSVAKVLAKESDCLISTPSRHTGPVRTMDFNPFRTNLLATGATESEIIIWDMSNTNNPMAPGPTSQPLEDVQHIAWNKRVQHIIASTFSQRCIIWDLRKNEPIIKLTDANSKVRWKVVQWHPDIATQLCLASEEDQSPVIELWDLRFATLPLKTLRSHQRGVLSIAWNINDSDLLLSSAKDNRILCWNPNSDAPDGEVICELAQTNQWNFDVAWCPRNPGLIVGTGFDGHAVVYSLLGGQSQASTETSKKLVDSFPGMDPFTQPVPQQPTEAAVLLKKAPKWLKRRSGVSFGFGGKLVIFENETADPTLPMKATRTVIISQVITNPELVQRSNELEATLRSEQFIDYCQGKADKVADDHDKKLWDCIGAYFRPNVTKELLEVLGYNLDVMHNKLSQFIPQDVDAITEGVAKLDRIHNGNVFDGSAAFDAIAQQEQNRKSPAVKPVETNFKINTTDDEDGLITQAILIGDIEAAVSLCFASKRYADAMIISITGGPELLARSQRRYFAEHSGSLNFLIDSLVNENWVNIVKNCDIRDWKEALIGVFANGNSEELSVLCDMLGDRLASSDDPYLRKQAQICYVCSGNVNKLVAVSNANIQELAELVTIMQKALEHVGIRASRTEENVALVISQYAEMLAAEGNFESALNYLGSSQEPRIITLRDRLCRALGYIQPEAQRNMSREPASRNYYDQSRKPQPIQQNVYPTVQPTQSTNHWNTAPTKSYGSNINQYSPMQAPPLATPTIPAMQPLSHDQYSNQQSYGQIPGPLPAAQPPPPPPPTSGSSLGGSRPSSVGPQTRSKHIVDPCVKSSSTYGQSGFSQPQMYNSQQVSPIPGYSSQNIYQPQTSMPQNPYAGHVQNQTFNSPLPEPQRDVQSGINAPELSNTIQQQFYNPIRSQPPTQMQSYNNESVYQSTMQPSGWNDPPIGKSSRTQSKPEFQPQNPILHPLLGASPQQDPNMVQDGYYGDSQIPYNQQQYGNQMQNSGIPINRSMEPLQPAQVAQSAQPEPEKPKAPIPEEHVHLKTVLDELRYHCHENAKNPQTKRKLEDVSKKLEVLYDCLRENKLSPNTLNDLHQISQMIQTGDYTGGLSLLTRLASSADFSTIASFMPGIKVLLQSALQLGVYIR
ncbi:protein transport protein Sec31A isoform X2 [Orussus abietinus]|uniref:protein transport protein Sec31A isoform X2 n=1 Tax=Orussus abietinus TaxID=222816 RepID=UPI0006263F71|nr:protein transport protein Sec31A isoform X2 [Orussus abietinus]